MIEYLYQLFLTFEVSLMSEPIKVVTSANRIYEELRRSIVVGNFRPGERLNADGLAATYGVSNTPIREALQMLNQEGLVTIKPHSGFYVSQMSLRQLRDMLELREVLEVAAFERAALNISEDQLAELEKVHTGYTGDDDESSDRYMAENRRFHYLVGRASGNLELADVIGHLHDRLAPHFVSVHTGDEMERIHQGLIDALKTRNLAVVREAIYDELNATRDHMLKRVITKDGDAWFIGAGENG